MICHRGFLFHGKVDALVHPGASIRYVALLKGLLRVHSGISPIGLEQMQGN